GGGRILTIDVTGAAGVPANGVAAVSLNVTATGADLAGYLTVWACGDRPTASSVNYTAGQAVPNAVIAPVSADGTICVYSRVDAHVIIDVNGWFATGTQFHPVPTTRMF